MSSASTRVQKRIGHRAGIFVLGLAIACLGAFAFAGPAKAAPEPFSTNFNNGKLDLGAAFADTTILPASNRIGDPPPLVPNLPDLWGSAVGNRPMINLLGSYDPDTGDVLIGPGAFQPPIMQVISPTDGSGVPITLRAQTPDSALFTGLTPVTGTFHEATGELNLDGTWSAHVLVGLGFDPPVITATCEIPLPGLSLSTNDNSSFTGTPYENGLGSIGAVTGEFTIVDDAIEHGLPPGACATVNTAVKGAGAVWFSFGQVEPTPFPVCPEGTEGTPPNCTPIPVPGKATKMNVKLKNRQIRAGKSTKLKITVWNGGEENLNAPVKLEVRRPGVRLSRRSVNINGIEPGKNRTAKVRVTAKRNAAGKRTAVVATLDDLSDGMRVKVLKRRKK